MKIVTLILVSLFSLSARADFEEGKSALLVNMGFTRGGMGLGIDYENAYHRTFGLGGYFRMHPDNNDTGGNGVTAFGAFIRPHFNRQSWDFYLSPGFGFVSYDPAGANVDSETMIGPSLELGLLYEFNSSMSFGVEQMSHYGWFGEADYRGELLTELSAKFRFVF